MCYAQDIKRREDNRMKITRKRIKTAFNEPYEMPLERSQIAMLLDDYESPVPLHIRSELWGQMFKFIVYDNFILAPDPEERTRANQGWRKASEDRLRALRQFWKLDFDSRLEIGNTCFQRAWQNLKINIWFERIYYEEACVDTPWLTYLEEVLGSLGCFTFSGKRRTKKPRQSTPVTLWVFPSPEDQHLADSLAKERYNDLESLTSFLITGTDKAAKRAAISKIENEQKHISLDAPARGAKGKQQLRNSHSFSDDDSENGGNQ
jgi:hypothetical protein